MIADKRRHECHLPRRGKREQQTKRRREQKRFHACIKIAVLGANVEGGSVEQELSSLIALFVVLTKISARVAAKGLRPVENPCLARIVWN